MESARRIVNDNNRTKRDRDGDCDRERDCERERECELVNEEEKEDEDENTENYSDMVRKYRLSSNNEEEGQPDEYRYDRCGYDDYGCGYDDYGYGYECEYENENDRRRRRAVTFSEPTTKHTVTTTDSTDLEEVDHGRDCSRDCSRVFSLVCRKKELSECVTMSMSRWERTCVGAAVRRLQGVCGDIVEHSWFAPLSLSCILINAVMMGVGTFVPNDDEHEEIKAKFAAADETFLWIFTVELVVMFGYHDIGLFQNPWLVFDLVIVLMSHGFRQAGNFKIVRCFRVFKAFRIFSRIKLLRDLIHQVFQLASKLTVICFLMFVVLYIYSVMFTVMFKPRKYDHHHDYNDYYNNYHNYNYSSMSLSLFTPIPTQLPTLPPGKKYNINHYFKRLDHSLFTCFQIMTLEDWKDVEDEMTQHNRWAWVYVVTLVVLSYYIIQSLFVAVICNAVVEFTRETQRRKQLKKKLRTLLTGDNHNQNNSHNNSNSHNSDSFRTSISDLHTNDGTNESQSQSQSRKNLPKPPKIKFSELSTSPRHKKGQRDASKKLQSAALRSRALSAFANTTANVTATATNRDGDISKHVTDGDTSPGKDYTDDGEESTEKEDTERSEKSERSDLSTSQSKSPIITFSKRSTTPGLKKVKSNSIRSSNNSATGTGAGIGILKPSPVVAFQRGLRKTINSRKSFRMMNYVDMNTMDGMDGNTMDDYTDPNPAPQVNITLSERKRKKKSTNNNDSNNNKNSNTNDNVNDNKTTDTRLKEVVTKMIKCIETAERLQSKLDRVNQLLSETETLRKNQKRNQNTNIKKNTNINKMRERGFPFHSNNSWLEEQEKTQPKPQSTTIQTTIEPSESHFGDRVELQVLTTNVSTHDT